MQLIRRHFVQQLSCATHMVAESHVSMHLLCSRQLVSQLLTGVIHCSQAGAVLLAQLLLLALSLRCLGSQVS